MTYRPIEDEIVALLDEEERQAWDSLPATSRDEIRKIYADRNKLKSGTEMDLHTIDAEIIEDWDTPVDYDTEGADSERNEIDEAVDMVLRAYWAETTDLKYASYGVERKWLDDHKEKVGKVLSALVRTVDASWTIDKGHQLNARDQFAHGLTPLGARKRQEIWTYLAEEPDRTVKQIAEKFGYKAAGNIYPLIHRMRKEGSIYAADNTWPKLWNAVLNYKV